MTVSIIKTKLHRCWKSNWVFVMKITYNVVYNIHCICSNALCFFRICWSYERRKLSQANGIHLLMLTKNNGRMQMHSLWINIFCVPMLKKISCPNNKFFESIVFHVVRWETKQILIKKNIDNYSYKTPTQITAHFLPIFPLSIPFFFV